MRLVNFLSPFLLYTLQSVLKDFADRSEEILKQAMVWAPTWTKSHIQEYVNKVNDLDHAGLSLAMDCVLQHTSYKKNTTAINVNIYYDKLPRCVKGEVSRFQQVLYLRAKYIGEVAGMLEEYGPEGTDKLIEIVLDMVKSSCKNNSDIMHRDSLWKATGLLISLPEPNRRLLHCIASSQVMYFCLCLCYYYYLRVTI